MVKWGILVIVFVLGILAYAGFDSLSSYDKEIPFAISGVELSSPNDRISDDMIRLYNNSILLKVENATIAEFTDTNSMDPFIDETANSIEIEPYDLKVGDVVSYSFEGKKIIHRIVGIQEDELGLYYIMKGDNNQFVDKARVREEQITGVVVGVLY